MHGRRPHVQWEEKCVRTSPER